MFKFYLRTAKTYLNYKLRRYTPFAIFFLVTGKCNLNCPGCIVRRFKFKKSELTTKEIFSLIEDASSLGTCYFSLTGGEPTMRDDLERIGQKIKEENMVSSLSTNGTLITKRRARKLVESFDYIRVSLDGPKEIHNRLRGEGSFRRALRGIRNLTSINPRNAKIGIISVISETNYKSVEQFYNKFKDQVDFVTFQPIHGISSIYSNPKFVRFWENMSKEKLGDLKEFIGRPSLKEGKKFCDAAKLYLHIAPEGTVYSCLIERDIKIGNLKEKSLRELWNSREIEKAREKTKDCIGCYSKCTTEISKIFRMDPLELIKNFWRLKKTYRL